MTNNIVITLHTFNDISEALLAQHKLKELGIDSFLEDENVVGLNPLGGVELKIFARDKAEAETLLLDR